MSRRLETHLARLAVRHPVWTLLLAAAMVCVTVAIIVTKGKIDSDILNLLPQRFDSVRALKVYDREFSQANEITFALWDETQEADMDGFAEYFGEALRKEPWVIRVMDRSPMETEGGIGEITQLAVPLLLNLPPQEFTAAMERLRPEAIRDRMARKRAEIQAGSPKAEMELNFDPLGVVVPAMKPIAGSFSTEPSRPLASVDGTLRLAIAVSNQAGLDAESCQEMMRKVDDFVERVRSGWSDGVAPKVLVTGRTAYVAEMSLGMKADVISTVGGSALLVTLFFYVAFRRIRPLVAILLVLLLCCLGAVAAGVLIFDELNVVTMGVCAIMIGIGVDFGMILYGTYQEMRNQGIDHETAAVDTVALLGRGLLFGAATAAVSFASLILSESPGFTQLGVLIGIGILLASLLMMTIFFAMISGAYRPAKPDILLVITRRYLCYLVTHSKKVALSALALLLLANALAYAPLGALRIDTDPRSLEPPNSKAGFALRKITSEVPAAEVEPVLAFIEADGNQSFHDQWTKASLQWTGAQEAGAIARATTPAAFALAPDRLTANLQQLTSLDFTAIRANFRAALEEGGFDDASFSPAFKMIDALETLGHGDRTPLDWRKSLPPSSSWIFVLDRFLSVTPNVGVAYIFPNKTLSGADEQIALRKALDTPGVTARLTGWSYVMADLVPWSKGKLIHLSLAMLSFIIIVLWFLYRSVAPLLVLLGSLLLSVGAMVATLKLTGLPLNLFNVLAFPLVLGIGVDYGIYIILAIRSPRNSPEALATVVKPVTLSALTTITAFGSLGLATNPALSSLGLVCAIGIVCSLFSTLFFILPVYLWRGYR